MDELTPTKAAEVLEEMATTWIKGDGQMNAALRLGASALRDSEWLDIARFPFNEDIEARDERTGFIRIVRMHECGAWILLGTADVFYSFDYFTHYRPLPSPPKEQK